MADIGEIISIAHSVTSRGCSPLTTTHQVSALIPVLCGLVPKIIRDPRGTVGGHMMVPPFFKTRLHKSHTCQWPPHEPRFGLNDSHSQVADERNIQSPIKSVGLGTTVSWLRVNDDHPPASQDDVALRGKLPRNRISWFISVARTILLSAKLTWKPSKSQRWCFFFVRKIS